MMMFTGQHVRLRAFQPSDRADFERFEADLEARQFMADALPFPPTAQDHDLIEMSLLRPDWLAAQGQEV